MKLSWKLARRKLREWCIRYVPAEICGTITAVSAFWVAHQATGSLAAAAIAATVGENIGYYSIAAQREIRRYWKAHRQHGRIRRAYDTGRHTLRDMLMEFGPAELIDSFAVRPSLFYLLPLWMPGQVGIALIIAKITADLVFYSIAIVCYEYKKRLIKPSVAQELEV